MYTDTRPMSPRGERFTNYVFVALLKCDTQDMVVEKVESIQHEPFAIADITKTWKQNPFLPEKIQEIRQAIELPP